MEYRISTNSSPYVAIVEQPQQIFRFRYASEGRTAGALYGANSSLGNKTYPTIRLMNYCGSARVIVSCVTNDVPYRPHPHGIAGKEGCDRGVCESFFFPNDDTIVFKNLGIQCVKRNEADEVLAFRESQNVDPFGTGFSHRKHIGFLDFSVVRFCFQVFLKDPETGKFSMSLLPVVSDPIYDEKSKFSLNIIKLSHCNAPCYGGQEMILLCKKLSKDNVQIRFFVEDSPKTVKTGGERQSSWEGFGDFTDDDVHLGCAITFRTPRFNDTAITQPVKVKLELKRLSDDGRSEALDFEFLPMNKVKADPALNRKRKKSNRVEHNRDVLDNISASDCSSKAVQNNSLIRVRPLEQLEVFVTKKEERSEEQLFKKEEEQVSTKDTCLPPINETFPNQIASSSTAFAKNFEAQLLTEENSSSSSFYPNFFEQLSGNPDFYDSFEAIGENYYDNLIDERCWLDYFQI